jgi:hypothetical protein
VLDLSVDVDLDLDEAVSVSDDLEDSPCSTSLWEIRSVVDPVMGDIGERLQLGKLRRLAM